MMKGGEGDDDEGDDEHGRRQAKPRTWRGTARKKVFEAMQGLRYASVAWINQAGKPRYRPAATGASRATTYSQKLLGRRAYRRIMGGDVDIWFALVALILDIHQESTRATSAPSASTSSGP